MGTVPNTFATMTGGNVQASDLDANFTALAGISGTPTNGHVALFGAGNNLTDGGAPAAVPDLSQFAPANPSSTTSTGGLMMGLGSTIFYKPTSSGHILLLVAGQLINGSAANITVTAHVRFGTGTAPANGAALAGTVAGQPQVGNVVTAAGFTVPFEIPNFLTLTVGTQYWFDLDLATSNASFAAAVQNIAAVLVEL